MVNPSFFRDRLPAFEVHGVAYYGFPTASSTPFPRAIAASAELSMARLNISRPHFEAFLELCDKYAGGMVPKTTYISSLLDVYDRLTWAVCPEVVYRAAACAFFDNTEDPYTVDFDYNEVKIKRWLGAGDSLGFFWELGRKLTNVNVPPLDSASRHYLRTTAEKSLGQMIALQTALAEFPTPYLSRCIDLQTAIVASFKASKP